MYSKVVLNKLKCMPKDKQDILKNVRKFSKRLGLRPFLVGGSVRDMLLGKNNFDLDIVIEGDGVILANYLAKKTNSRLTVHKRFGTATIHLSDKFKLDIATARTESYEYPGALPKVSFTSINEDLCRRDFTINAMAIDISDNNFGQLLDLFKGRKDLEDKNIRILYDESFIDDPTRMLRAIRFEQRYKFHIEHHTLRLLKKAVEDNMLERVKKPRIKDELISMLKESDAISQIKRLNKLCGISFIHSGLRLSKNNIRALRQLSNTIIWFRKFFPKKRPLDAWLIYFILICDKLSINEIRKTGLEFGFKKGDVKRMLSYKEQEDRIPFFLNGTNLSAFRIYRALQPLAYEVIILILAKTKNKRISNYIKKFLKYHNEVKLAISGKDLKKMGFMPSKQFKKTFDSLLEKKISGKLRSKKDELEFLKKFF